jgi:hypothetical protein
MPDPRHPQIVALAITIASGKSPLDQVFSNPKLPAGGIVSTGTLTLAMPVTTGQVWTTRAFGIPLNEIALRFE